MIYKFRIISDESEEFFRVIEIDSSLTMEDLHNAIIDAVGYEKGHVSSFYLSNNEWDREQEISLMDMSDEESDIPALLMNETPINSMLRDENDKLIYVFDFFSDRAFYITLTEIFEPVKDVNYPMLAMSNGEPPEQFQIDDELDDLMKQFEMGTLGDENDKPAAGSSKYDMDDELEDEDFGEHDNLDDYLDKM